MRRAVRRAANGVVADTTFSYRPIPWTTSEGETYEYQCVVAAPPEHHQLPLKDRVHVALIPSLDLSTAGKEDMRPLAKELSDLGHWSYLLEWPGWTMDGAVNWALHRCKLENLREEYEDFWVDILREVRPKDKETPFRIVAAGDLAASIVSESCATMKVPVRKFEVKPGYTKRWSPRWGKWLAEKLEAESKFARLIQRQYFAPQFSAKLRRPVLPSDGVTDEIVDSRHRRPRPLTHTDMALVCGYLDKPREVPTIETKTSALLVSELWQ